MRLSPLAFAGLLLIATPLITQAAPTTSTGQISVAQVVELSSRSGADPNARMTMIAYLAGVGEATGLMVGEAKQRGASVQCSRDFNLDENTALAAVAAAVPDRDKWTETPATPIIIADMFKRAGCR
ncbi:chlorophyllide reductase [Devosia sp. ZW T5_3]|uniref:chlorophyllide reductase n=1 Tax=Devosia sp. ZW T5_3 TaxID=3378085 RepID=UPI003854B359